MSDNSPKIVTQISVVIDSRIYGYLFAPIIDALTAEDTFVFVYSPKRILDDIKRDIGIERNVEFLNLDPIRKKNRWRYLIHRIAMDIFVRDDFSYQLFKKNQELTKKLPTFRRILVKCSRLLPKVSNKSINKFLKRIAGFGLRNPFRTKVVMAGSLNGSAELLCSKEQVVITVMESWDHAVKHPNGYTSDIVFAWNDDLCRDWRRVHNDCNVQKFYPLKLRYARNVVSNWKRAIESQVRPFFVYSVASTRRFSINVLTTLEQSLIRDLAKAADSAGWDLFIKPRPNGEDGEFESILAEHSNVRVGSIVSDKVGYAADYFLSEDYNFRRFSEIAGAKFIVNAFTTFGLDAAAAGIPVLQLDIRSAYGYDSSNLVYENYHLKNYLLSRGSVLRITGELVSEFKQYLLSPNSFPESYTSNLDWWLFEGRSQEDAVKEFVSKVLEITSCNSK